MPFSVQLSVLESEKKSLLELWEERRILYEQCMDLQLFVRDTEQADAWMTKQEVGIIPEWTLAVGNLVLENNSTVGRINSVQAMMYFGLG